MRAILIAGSEFLIDSVKMVQRVGKIIALFIWNWIIKPLFWNPLKYISKFVWRILKACYYQIKKNIFAICRYCAALANIIQQFIIETTKSIYATIKQTGKYIIGIIKQQLTIVRMYISGILRTISNFISDTAKDIRIFIKSTLTLIRDTINSTAKNVADTMRAVYASVIENMIAFRNRILALFGY
jgi:phage-related protein